MKQPAAGILATVMVMAISLGLVSLFSFEVFSGWVTFLFISFIPMQIVISVTWGSKHPGFASKRRQPAKGILLVLLALAAGFVVAAVHHATVGGQVDPPAPMLVMCIIVSVAVTFWMAIMWGGWPFTALIKNPVAAGLALLVGCYVLNYLLFRLFFDFSFMQGAPVYVAALDPHGMFNAWNAIVFYVTALAVMFLMLSFDLWPLTKFPAVMKQPVLGIVWTIVVLLVGGLAFYLGVVAGKMDVAAFMVQVPIPFIFGTIVVLNMLQGSLFARFSQPLKGVLNTIAVVIVGTLLARMYSALAPALTGKLNAGPPGYDFERWLASALLAVTFPFLIFYAEFFKFWPLRKAD